MTDTNARDHLREAATDDANPHLAALAAGSMMAGALIAKAMDMLGGSTGLPAPQMPHTFAGALGAVAALGATDADSGEAFRAGLTLEQYADVLAAQVRENFLLNAAMHEAAGGPAH